jgi:hypothetical protein
MRRLATTADVIEVLGAECIKRVFGVGDKSIFHWKYTGFPPHTYKVLRDELAKHDCFGDMGLWNFSDKAGEATG